MVENRLIFRGVYLNYLHLLVSMVSLMVLTPVLLRSLGQAGYGLWAVLSSIMSYFALCDFGMNTAVAKYAAECRALKQKEKLDEILSTTFFFLCVLGTVLILMCLGLSRFVPQLFGVGGAAAFEARSAFVLVGVNVALWLLGGVFGNLLYGYERIDVWKASSIAQQVVNFLLTLLFLQMGWGLIGVAVASISSTATLISLYVAFFSLARYDVRIHLRLVRQAVIREILPYSIRTFILGLTSRLLYYAHNIVIGILLGAARVTPYELAYKLCFLTTYLFSAISTTAFPRFSGLYAKGDIEGARTLYLNIVKVTLLIMTSLGLGLFFLGEFFITLWVGEGNFAGSDVLVLLIMMNVFHAIGTPAAALLQGIGRNKELMYSEILNAGLNVTFTIALVPRVGLAGAALGTLAGHLCSSFWVVLLLPCKCTKVALQHYLVSCVVPPLFCAAPAAVAGYAMMQKLPPPGNLLDLVLRGGGIATMYIITYLAVGATKEERQMYLRLVRGMAAA
jgi:O-antigen/teichoic acid export membrane protein